MSKTDFLLLLASITASIPIGTACAAGTHDLTARDQVKLEGSGNKTIKGIHGGNNVIIAEGTHSAGKSFGANFIVELKESEDDHPTQFFNETGDYEGTQAETAQPGNYMLTVEADGDWSVTLSHPDADSARAPPVDISGPGDDVVGPVKLGGERTFSLNYDGPRNATLDLHSNSTRGLLYEPGETTTNTPQGEGLAGGGRPDGRVYPLPSLVGY